MIENNCPPQNDALPGETNLGKAPDKLVCRLKNVLPSSRVCFNCGTDASPKRVWHEDIAGGIVIRIPQGRCPVCGGSLCEGKDRMIATGQVTLCTQ